MTPEERAEKISYLFRDEFDVPPYLIPKIAAQIAEAEREVFSNEHVAGKISATLADIAYRKGLAESSMMAVDMDKALRQEFEAGFSAARAKAAGVVREKYFEDSCAEEWLAARIEALEP